MINQYITQAQLDAEIAAHDKAQINKSYPIDTILERADNTDPASYIGGTWEQVNIYGAEPTFNYITSSYVNVNYEKKQLLLSLNIPANTKALIVGYTVADISDSNTIMSATLAVSNMSGSLLLEDGTRTIMNSGGGCEVTLSLNAVAYDRKVELYTYGYRNATTPVKGKISYIFVPQATAKSWKRIE